MPGPAGRAPRGPGDQDDEIAALELGRRAEASDVGNETAERLALAVDDLATAYPGTPPGELLGRVRVHLGYVGQLLGARTTLAQHRGLLVTGGWLSLLAATCLIDLHREAARRGAPADRRAVRPRDRPCRDSRVVRGNPGVAGADEGDYRRAAGLAQAAQRLAPHGGSAYIQATAQEGRAWARLGAAPETRAALARVEALVSPMPVPDRPEHHYRYDPAKAEAYVATTLAWLVTRPPRDRPAHPGPARIGR